MSIQAELDNQLINALPKIKKIILEHKEDTFMRSQLISVTLRYSLNSKKCIKDMTEEELEKFQEELIGVFKFHEFIMTGSLYERKYQLLDELEKIEKEITSLGVDISKRISNFPQPLSPKKANELIKAAMENKEDWEKVHTDTWRMEVEKGWVLESSKQCTFLFIPDPDHIWEL